MDASIRLKDTSGKILAESDDVEDAMQGLMTHHADPILQFRAKSEDYYTVEVQDLSGNYGPDYFFLLERKENIPTYEVFVSPANMNIPKGGTGIFRVDIISKEKFTPALEMAVKGLPKGYKLSSLNTSPGTKNWDISITAPEDAAEQQLALEVTATATLRGREAEKVTQKAIAADNMMQAFYYTHHIPAAGFVADITQSAPFSLHIASSSERELQQAILVKPTDNLIPIKLRINRKEGFTDTVELALNKKLKQITLDPVSFQSGETEKVVYLNINPEARKTTRKFRGAFSIVGTVNGEIEKRGKRTFQNALYREYSEIFVLELKQQ
jgi:hypothetical protein